MKSLELFFQHEYSLVGYQAHITQVHSTSHSFKCMAAIDYLRNPLGWYEGIGTLQLRFSRSAIYHPQIGDRLVVRGSPIPRSPSLKKLAHQPASCFSQHLSYTHYLRTKGKNFLLLPPTLITRLITYRHCIHQWCYDTFNKWIQCETSAQLVHSLLLGQKNMLPSQLQQAYTKTGTIHLLAVSGLHVSMFSTIVYRLLRAIFQRFFFTMCIEWMMVAMLWIYAWICGCTPSVLRATVMATLSIMGLIMGRPSNSCHVLYVSAMVLLLYNPHLLFHIGFQLSYTATLAILYLAPLVYSMLTFKNHLLQKLWKMTTLSIAAQIGTLPLILHYFNQFPTYFIMANWIAVPAMFIILTLSGILLTFAYLPLCNMAMGYVLKCFISATNWAILAISNWPLCTLSIASIHTCTVGVVYILLIAICYLVQRLKQQQS